MAFMTVPAKSSFLSILAHFADIIKPQPGICKMTIPIAGVADKLQKINERT